MATFAAHMNSRVEIARTDSAFAFAIQRWVHRSNGDRLCKTSTTTRLSPHRKASNWNVTTGCLGLTAPERRSAAAAQQRQQRVSLLCKTVYPI